MGVRRGYGAGDLTTVLGSLQEGVQVALVVAPETTNTVAFELPAFGQTPHRRVGNTTQVLPGVNSTHYPVFGRRCYHL